MERNQRTAGFAGVLQHVDDDVLTDWIAAANAVAAERGLRVPPLSDVKEFSDKELAVGMELITNELEQRGCQMRVWPNGKPNQWRWGVKDANGNAFVIASRLVAHSSDYSYEEGAGAK